MHKKVGKLMQIGGHIELNETPWQAVTHELEEESGYTLNELSVMQPFADFPDTQGSVVHPIPFTMNTHNVGDEHYHSDLCYGFVTKYRPMAKTSVGESDDLRWLTLAELRLAAASGEVLKDMVEIYSYLIMHRSQMTEAPAVDFSLEKPSVQGAAYKFGSASEQREQN